MQLLLWDADAYGMEQSSGHSAIHTAAGFLCNEGWSSVARAYSPVLDVSSKWRIKYAANLLVMLYPSALRYMNRNPASGKINWPPAG